jgi:hypothetical protein
MLLSGEHRKALAGGQPLEIHNPSETYLINVCQKTLMGAVYYIYYKRSYCTVYVRSMYHLRGDKSKQQLHVFARLI